MVQKAKKLISIILAVAVIMSGTLILPPQGFAEDLPPVNLAEISLNKTSSDLIVGQSFQLIATLLPANTSYNSVSWSIASQLPNDTVTMSSSGQVTATNIGTAVIKATSNFDPTKYAECNVTVYPSATISGTISLPAGETASNGAIDGIISIQPEIGGYGYNEYFTIPSLGNSASYAVAVPVNVLNAGYRVSYKLYNNSGNYVRAGYYSATGTTSFINSTLVNVNNGNALNINLTPFTGHTISGTISLPNSALSAGLQGSIIISPNGGTSSGGGGAGPVGAGDNESSLKYYAYFTINPGLNSGSYTTEAIPIDTTISGYSVNYNLYNNPQYVGEGYYSSEVGTTTSKYATLVDINPHNVSNIDLTLLTGHIISGTISLPNNATVLDRSIFGAVYVDPLNGENHYFGNFNIPAQATSGEYSVMVPSDPTISGYRVNYHLYGNYEYVGEGYFTTSSSSGNTTTSNFATLVNANDNNAPNTNLTLLTGNTISGTVSMPTGVTVPVGLELYVSIDPLDGGTPYTTYLFIPEGRTSGSYTVTVPVNAAITGYRVNYGIRNNNVGYIEKGYYVEAGITTSDSNLATPVNINPGNASNINLELLIGTTLPSAIYPNKSTTSIPVGQTEQLTALISPNYTTDKGLTWTVFSQSGSNIATVSDTGLVTAVNEGTAVIRAASKADISKYADCTVTVFTIGDIPLLVTAIAMAEDKHDQAIEGIAVGNYPVGSKLILQNAISAAQTILELGTPTIEQVTQAVSALTTAMNVFEAGRVPPEGLSATPVVKIGVNPSANDIAGMFIGFENIVESESSEPQTYYSIAGYEIEVTFDANQVSIPDVLDTTGSGDMFIKNIHTVGGIGKVLVSCLLSGSINQYDKLFFIPITLKGSAHVPTKISVEYLDVRENGPNLLKIEVPTLDNLWFQRGKIYNGELGNPNIADAIAGLQFLALLRDPGMGLQEVNLVNMGSTIESDVYSNVVKPNIKDIIALMQYTVDLRDDHFIPINSTPKKLDFDFRRMDGTLGGTRLEIFDDALENDDIVQVLKGSNGSNLITPVTVQKSVSGKPLVLDNLNFGGELYLKVRITRGGFVGERLIFEKMKVSIADIRGAVNTTNITDITVSGLQTGDQVSLYTESGMKIGSTLTVETDSLSVTFNDISIVDNGVRVQINRPTPASATPSMFYKWGDLIKFGCKTDITPTGLETLTVQYLESGDLVNLYNSDNTAITDQQGLTADAGGKVIISGLTHAPYLVEVVRVGVHSRREWVNPPNVHVDFGAGISKDNMGVKQLKLYDLKAGDQVQVLKGSDNTVNFVAPFTVEVASPNPIVIDCSNLGGELFLKVSVTRNTFVSEQDVFDDLYISMGTISVDNTTSITLYGLKTGDQVSLYQNDGPQIGSTQDGDTSQPTVFTNVPILEEGYRFDISRTGTVSSTGTTYRRPKGLITVWWKTDIAENNRETITMQYLESGDRVNLYDAEGNPIVGKQGLQPGTNGEVTISDLVPRTYQVKVIRGAIYSDMRRIDPPDFWSELRNEAGSKQLRLFNLIDGDLVEILKGSTNTSYIDSFTVVSESINPWILNDINFGNELFLKVIVTRNGKANVRYVYDNLVIVMRAITKDTSGLSTTSISLYGLKTGDEVGLYRGDGSQIGSTQSVTDNNPDPHFSGISITGEEGVKFKFSRPSLGINVGEDYRQWKDMIMFKWNTDITENYREIITLKYLENGDVVNLYDSEGNAITGRQGLPAGTNGELAITDLVPRTYQVEVVRGDFRSYLRKINPPDFWPELRNESGGKQLRLFNLISGDQVRILKGSNYANYVDSFTVASENLNPWILNDIDFGSELFLKVIVTRNGIENVRYVYDNLFIVMGAITKDTSGLSTTSISLYGLKTGDEVGLYRGDGSQIGSTQSVTDNNPDPHFSGISITGEEGVKFKFRRPSLGSNVGEDYRQWKDMIMFEWNTDITENYHETITLRYLENGDVVNLYDSDGNAISEKQGLPSGTNGELAISDLVPRTYQVEVVRGDFRSYLRKINPPDFWAELRNESGGKQLRLNNLISGDQVRILKGSNYANYVDSFTVASENLNPWILNDIDFGSELFLKVIVTRNGIENVRYVYDNLVIVMRAIVEDINTGISTTSINLYGLQTGDEVGLYRGDGSQIGSTQSVTDNNPDPHFSGISITGEEGVKFKFSRPSLSNNIGEDYRQWKDMIMFKWNTDITENNGETITLRYLESGDVVNLYDSEGNAIAGKQGLPAGINGELAITGLEPRIYQVEVVRGDFRSYLRKINAPPVNFWAGISNNDLGVKQIKLYDLRTGDQVKILKGSDYTDFMQPLTVAQASPNPIIIDSPSFGSELFLKVIVTRGGIEGVRYVYDDLFIHMGAIAEDNTTGISISTTSISLSGLKTGDQIGLYRGDGSQIGSTQSVGDNDQAPVFNDITITGEEGVQFRFSRPSLGSGTSIGYNYRRWKDMIAVNCRTDIIVDRLELTLQDLESGDIVNLYDSAGVDLEQSLTAETDGQVVFSDLEISIYQIEVVRKNIHSDWRKIYPPQLPPPTGGGGGGGGSSVPFTATPEIMGTVRAGDTSVSGTATVDASVVLSVNGVAKDPVIASNGSWTVSGLTLVQDDVISVTAQSVGETVSPANDVTVSALELPT